MSAAPRHGAVGVTASMEDYLCSIYRLQEPDGTPAGNRAIAQALGVTPASATAMVKRLAHLGLVEHAPCQGCRLTPAGERMAQRVVRRHRLLEAFLATELGMGTADVHAEADRLEHALSDTVGALLAQAMGDPTHDPHGRPIPAAGPATG